MGERALYEAEEGGRRQTIKGFVIVMRSLTIMLKERDMHWKF